MRSYEWFRAVYAKINNYPELFQYEINDYIANIANKKVKNRRHSFNAKIAYIVKLNDGDIRTHNLDMPIRLQFDDIYNEIMENMFKYGEDYYHARIKNRDHPIRGNFIKLYACSNKDGRYIILELSFIPKANEKCAIV